MYEDRLIVENYILKMTQNVYQIREISNDIETRDLMSDINILTNDFKYTYTLFSKTKLTETEKKTADQLITNFNKLERLLATNKIIPSNRTDEILSSLNKLSAIQLDESKLIMEQVESQYATIKASSQFAFAIIIIILIVLQIMVFSGDSLIPQFKPKDPSLN